MNRNISSEIRFRKFYKCIRKKIRGNAEEEGKRRLRKEEEEEDREENKGEREEKEEKEEDQEIALIVINTPENL